MQSALELALGQGRPDQGGDAAGRLAPRAKPAEGCATAWVLHNLNRTRTQNACVAIESGFIVLRLGITAAAGIVYIVQPHQVQPLCTACIVKPHCEKTRHTKCSPTAAYHTYHDDLPDEGRRDRD